MVTIAGTLRERACTQPERLAFRELRNDLRESDRVTYGDLNRRARVLAARLEGTLAPGDRALLLIPGAIDYLTALFACFYSGVIAVSGVPPYSPSTRKQRHAARLERLKSVVAASGVSAIVGPVALLSRLREVLAQERLRFIATDSDGAGETEPPLSTFHDEADAIAMLQFTSGSTTAPGAVALSHRNLSSNLDAQREAFRMTQDDVGVSWLPLFHDLGLIGAGLLPIRVGFPCVLLPAAGFLEQPGRWLACISKERATISWAPNFAYRLCAKAVPPEARESLDLSRWRIAMNAAEPVQAETIRQFAAGFSKCGFHSAAMYPAYGLAEATLAVSAPVPGSAPFVIRVDKAALAQDRVEPASATEDATELVGCGHPVPGVELAIVNVLTGRRCPLDRVGEIWVRGDGVSEGYFGDAARSAAFGATLLSESGSWLRTGDLGFFRDGHLFVTGRLKDVIILRGANIYPQDLEVSAVLSHPALREDCACAFPVVTDGEEALAIVCEIGRKREGEAVEAALAIRRGIFEHHGLEVHTLAIARMGAVPKTPSGKLQRKLCREALERGRLPLVLLQRTSPASGAALPKPLQSRDGIAAWVLARLAQIEPDIAIDLSSEFADLGLSSVKITELAAEIESVFGRRIPAADLYELRRVGDVVHCLVALAEAGAAGQT
jgi:acyl-CoA synthetase (AMP-forming)/AMP-acid ligase II/acyl carrier protein